jgi:hypothetical protein
MFLNVELVRHHLRPSGEHIMWDVNLARVRNAWTTSSYNSA